MIKKYWFYDVSAGDYEGKEAIWLWVLDTDGNIHIIVDTSFRNFFYVDADVADEDRFMKDVRSLLSGVAERDFSIDKVRMKLYGGEKDFYRVEASDKVVKLLINGLRRIYGEKALYEDDIRFTTKYHLFKGLDPCSWYSFDVDGLYEKDGIKFEYLNNVVGEVDEHIYPSLKIVSLDTIITSKYGEPDSKKDPVNYLVLYDGSKFIELWSDNDDTNILRELSRYIRELNPHVIITFGGNRFIWPYLIGRSNIIGCKLDIGLMNIEVHQSLYGHTSIAGRIHIDLKDYVDDLPIMQMKTLEELASYLGLGLLERTIDELQYYYYWNEDRDSIVNYVRWRAETLYNAFGILKEHFFNLSSITGIPPDYVVTASSGRQAEYYIMRRAFKLGEIIPRVVERGFRSYPGGLVLKPRKGVHSDVAVIDFKSMYPNLIIKYNVSPDTIVHIPGENIDFYEDLSIGVRRDVDGLFPIIAKHLIEERDSIRSRMSSVDRGSPEYRILDARQKVLKILANTLYGYMGWLGARWYSYEGASLITYLGRKVISESLEKARELGLDVIYGDTDSIFVKYDPDKVGDLLRWIDRELGLEAKVDKIYSRVLFTEAKKRYAGLTVDGFIDIVGLEYVRRDWCEFAKEAQYKIVKMVLEGFSKNNILGEFRGLVNLLRSGKVPLSKLVIWEQITRPLEEYKARAPHIAVAEDLERRGWSIRRGMFIGYVIYRGEGPLYKRAVHYLDADTDKLDIDYYIYNQLIPVVVRVLEPIGVSPSTLESIARSSGVGLDAFIGGV
jgi:DNA polymerase I